MKYSIPCDKEAKIHFSCFTILVNCFSHHIFSECSVLLSHMWVIFQVGDGTNFILVFSGALLNAAEELLRMVNSFKTIIHPSGSGICI